MECGSVPQKIIDLIASALVTDADGNVSINLLPQWSSCEDLTPYIDCDNNHIPSDELIGNAVSEDDCGNVALGVTIPYPELDPEVPIKILYRYTDVETTLTAADYQIEAVGAFDINLPPSVLGTVYSIKNTGTGTITVVPYLNETIDGEVYQTLSQWDNLMIMSNGTNWLII